MSNILDTPTGAGKTESAIAAIIAAAGAIRIQQIIDSGQPIELPSLGIVLEPDQERRTVTVRAIRVDGETLGAGEQRANLS